MMAHAVSDFRTAFPEITTAEASDATVQAELARVETAMPSGSWGASWDLAVMLQVAIGLAGSPFERDSYQARFDALDQARAPALSGDETAQATAIATAQATADAVEVSRLADRVRTDFALATLTSVHMDDATQGLDVLVDLAGGATQAAANARAEALRTAFLAHAASVGTPAATGAHLAEDTANAATLNAIPEATEINSCIVLVNGLQAAIVAHGDETGVHFSDDATAVASTMTNDPPTTLAHLITDLNEILATYVDHFARAVTDAGGQTAKAAIATAQATADAATVLADPVRIPAPAAAWNANKSATDVVDPVTEWAPTAARKFDPRTATKPMAVTFWKSNSAAFGITIDVTTGGNQGWTTDAGLNTDFPIVGSDSAAPGQWLIRIDLANKRINVLPVG